MHRGMHVVGLDVRVRVAQAVAKLLEPLGRVACPAGAIRKEDLNGLLLVYSFKICGILHGNRTAVVL
jgi:hypothetical protein